MIESADGSGQRGTRNGPVERGLNALDTGSGQRALRIEHIENGADARLVTA